MNALTSWNVLPLTTLPERLARGQRNAVASEHVADLALRDGHERHDVHLVHERRAEVDPTSQHVGW